MKHIPYYPNAKHTICIVPLANPLPTASLAYHEPSITLERPALIVTSQMN